MQTDWAIVGGGIHGVHIALRLLEEGGVSRDRLRIVDPADRLLTRWHECTRVTGMQYLRSSSVHHLATDAYALRRFAKSHRTRGAGQYAHPYDRPSLELFDDHCDQLIAKARLEELHVRDRVEEAVVGVDGVTLRLNGGQEITARRIVLAIGSSDEPHWPEWAPRDDARVHHVFQPEFDGWPAAHQESIAVVGGGVSAAQVALRLSATGHRVFLVARHELREKQFDVSAGWLGPKFMAGFQRSPDHDHRRWIIDKARQSGTMPSDVRKALIRAVGKGTVEMLRTEVSDVARREGGLALHLSDGSRAEVDHLLLATGFTSKRPGGALVDRLVESASLPCAGCGYPVVDSLLRWHRRIHVSGPLAELELGPASRNIAGARRAGERIVQSVQRDLTTAAV